jgi:alpha-L-fucosidase
MLLLGVACAEKSATNPSVQPFANQAAALHWLDSAKYGMFVHWGLYSVPAGIWKGLEAPGNAEWIMRKARIPAREYEQLARQFNPVDFDADAWVKTAKAAGMQYLVITAKHHDGFALFDSPSSSYDIVDATSYGQDPMKQLAEACRKHGLRLGFYYSHDQDWHHPHATGNDWDYDPDQKDFAQYLEEKVKPQVRELLTQYGPIAIIWFDTPKSITPEQSRALVELVHELQPNCLVSDRVGHEMGDYQGFADHQVPGGVVDGVWETVGTTNESWGYKPTDQQWKSPELIIKLLTNIVSKGGVYLLNVGPDAQGNLPQPAVDSLLNAGEWLAQNGEAIYGADPSPYLKEFEWGAITTKPGKLYLHLYEWPANGTLRLAGFRTTVTGGYLLADSSGRVTAEVADELLTVRLPERAPAGIGYVPVVVLTTEGKVTVNNDLTNDLNGTITLPAYLANLHRTDSSRMSIEGGGIAYHYYDTADWMDWNFTVTTPGTYDIILHTAVGPWAGWVDEHEVALAFQDSVYQREIKDYGRTQNLSTLHWQDTPMLMATVTIDRAGEHSLRLKPQKINRFRNQGLRVRKVTLVPGDQQYMQTVINSPVKPIYPYADQEIEYLQQLKQNDL